MSQVRCSVDPGLRGFCTCIPLMDCALNSHERELAQISMLMAQGEFEKAYSKCRSVIEIYGPHIGLNSNLAYCAQLTGRTIECRRIVSNIEVDLLAQKETLSFEEQARTHLILGKILEEDGRLTRALQNYRATSHLSDSDDNSALYRGFANELRLLVILGFTEEVAKLYEVLRRANFLDSDSQYEVEHALLTAEALLFGVEQASLRFQKLLTQSLLNTDSNLIVFDLLEISIRKNQTPPINLREIAFKCRPLDDYERLLQKMLLGQEINVSELSSSQINLFSAIRLSYFYSKTTGHASTEMIKFLHFLLFEIPASDRDLLMRQWNLKISMSKVSLESLLHLRLTKLEKSLVQILVKGPSPTEELLKALYGQTYSDYAYQKVRVLSHRLNKKIERELLIPNAISVSKDLIRIEQ